MGTNEIIKLAKDLKFKFKDISTIDIINLLNIPLSYTNLKPNLYPAFTMDTGTTKAIVLNNFFNLNQQNILAAHELGHAILHKDKLINQFGGENKQQEYEANLFAVALLFDENKLNVPLNRMSNYELKYLLDYNIKLKKSS